MCGIFGWFGRDDEAKLKLMADSLRHRGPDGEGYFFQENIALGMTRLAIIDRENGQQPMISDDGQVIVVFNGEIYNFHQLKLELVAQGFVFKTASDAEVLPAAYQAWGMQFLDKLNGMFAIALFDKEKGQLLLARDRCGQKPLYYAEHDGVMYFASEIRALSAAGVPKVLYREKVNEYLRLRYVREPDTLFKNIKILQAGHMWLSSSHESYQWWSLNELKRNSGGVNRLKKVTSEAVRTALVSDESMAVHLSAGIDSSVLLGEIVKAEVEVTAITASFGADSDEAKEAGVYARRLGVEHHLAELGPENLSSLPRVVEQMELPVGDALIVAFDRLAMATKDVGAKVALGGEGIDEIFGGYSFHKAMLSAEKLGSIGRTMAAGILKFLPASLVQKMAAFPADLGASGLTKISNYLRDFNSLSDLEKGIQLRTLFEHEELSEPMLENLILDDGEGLLDRHIRFQFRSWLQDWAIIRQERNCMAHSIEYRMPFLDHRLIELGVVSPDNAKIAGRKGKALWRQLGSRAYPEAASHRSKQPFYFPVEHESYFGEIVNLWDEYLENSGALVFEFFPKGQWKKLRAEAELSREFLPLKKAMALLILEIWSQQHFG